MTTTRKIYILRASRGSYSDRSEWTVRSYASEDRAKAAREEAAEAIAAAYAAYAEEIERRRSLRAEYARTGRPVAVEKRPEAWWLDRVYLPDAVGERGHRADPEVVCRSDDGSRWLIGYPYESPDYEIEPVDLVEEPGPCRHGRPEGACAEC